MGSARCLLADSKLERKYWPEAIRAAAYLKNRVITNTIERKTPFEIFFKKRPDISNLRLYGSIVFARRPDINRDSKSDVTGDSGILVGYDSVGYKVLINGKIKIVRHVDIIEKNETLVGFQGNDDDSLTSDSEISELNEIRGSNESNEERGKALSPNLRQENSSENNLENQARRSARRKKKPDRYRRRYSKFELHLCECSERRKSHNIRGSGEL